VDGSGYPKIPLTPVRVSGGEWVAREKLHGAQLALRREGTMVRAFARRRRIDPEAMAGFFGLDAIWPKLVAAFSLMEAAGATVVFGELVGDDPRTGRPVQPETRYGPLRWCPFDVRADTAWLADSEVRSLAAEVGLVAAPLVGRGPYQRVAALPLPPMSLLAATPAEGLVLVPARAWPDADGERPAFKRKRPDFAEDGDWAGPRPVLASAEASSWLLDVAAQLLTPPRADGAISRLGPSDRPALVDELVGDVLADVAAQVGGLDELDRAALEAAVRPAAEALLDARTAL
jgi:hypothetical protein